MRESFLRSMRAHGRHDSEMPLRGYFLWVGGALLALLFAADRLVPQMPSDQRVNSSPKFPLIRIHSELKGPEAVVIDTSQRRIVPTLASHEDEAAPHSFAAYPEDDIFEQLTQPLPRQADANDGSPVTSVPLAPHIREAFAQSVSGPLKQAGPTKTNRVELRAYLP